MRNHGFDADVPANAVIEGVQVRFRQAVNTASFEYGLLILVNDIAAVTGPRTDTNNVRFNGQQLWPATPDGGDLWGEPSLSTTVVRSSSFGLTLTAIRDSTGQDTLYLDEFELRVRYNVPTTGTTGTTDTTTTATMATTTNAAPAPPSVGAESDGGGDGDGGGSGEGLPAWLLALIVVAGLFCCGGLLAAAVVMVVRRRRAREDANSESSGNHTSLPMSGDEAPQYHDLSTVREQETPQYHDLSTVREKERLKGAGTSNNSGNGDEDDDDAKSEEVVYGDVGGMRD